MSVSEKSNLIKVIVILTCLVVALLAAYFSGFATTGTQIVYLLASLAVVLAVYVFGVGSWWGFLSSGELKDSYPAWSASPSPQPTSNPQDPEERRQLESDSQKDTGSRAQPGQKGAAVGDSTNPQPSDE